MKKLTVLTSILFLAALGFVSCSADKTTELGWTNKSGEAINTIVWADGDATWENGTTGYDPVNNPDTDQKEVSKLQGSADCKIWDGADFVGADTVSINDGGNDLTLNEGESLHYDLSATVPVKKK